MKKIIISVFCLIFALCLVGCGENEMMDDLSSGMNSAKDMVESTADKVTDGAMELVASITGDQAKRKAFEHAGVKEEEVKDLDVDLDRDGMTLIFEIDFKHGDTEYDYNINAMTGKILSADKDRN
ncbi:MAG: hypothetical protein E7540_05830 [Ruminococcaceae bacterium]|nr:hypothetical protein [Oscillospiraceae bacterium]